MLVKLISDYQMIAMFRDETSTSNGGGNNDRIVAIVQSPKSVCTSLINWNKPGTASETILSTKYIIVSKYSPDPFQPGADAYSLGIPYLGV